MELLKKIESVCPVCADEGDFRHIEARLFEVDGKVVIKKKCKEHGEFEDVYNSNVDDWRRAEKFKPVGRRFDYPIKKGFLNECPNNCGPCSEHLSKTTLAIIDVTNRCNMQCPPCFADTGKHKPLYEPTIEQIDSMLNFLVKVNEPKPVRGIQISGGEPTVRDDLVEIIKLIKKYKIDHIELNTNGLKIGEEVKGVYYLKDLMDAGLSTLYQQFDGLTYRERLETRVPKSIGGVELSEEGRIEKAEFYAKRQLNVVKNARKAGLTSVVLVATLVKGVNDHQIWDIIEYARENSDVVRCVNFQPVAFAGRMSREDLKKKRITKGDLVYLIEKQSGGVVKATDFYPVPVMEPLAIALEAMTGRRDYYDLFSCHQQCGTATFLDLKTGEPITRHIDVDNLAKELKKVGKKNSLSAKIHGLGIVRKYTDKELKKRIISYILDPSYEKSGEFMHNILMISCMHFMDKYNFDYERLRRCTIHYVVPDKERGGRLIPFCSMNNRYRSEIEKEFCTKQTVPQMI
jgi:uncharacterized radical SAM superfamily Fe-S cluster-containing enzyme